jgi:hypothetical protein
MPVRLEVLGLNGVGAAAKRLTAMAKALENSPKSVAHDAANEYRRSLKEAAPVKSGALRDSIGFRTQTGLGASALAVFHMATHGKYIIAGTRPHDIWAGFYMGGSGSKVLVFEMGGGLIHTPHVSHPGAAPNDFRKEATSASKANVTAILRKIGLGVVRSTSMGFEQAVENFSGDE